MQTTSRANRISRIAGFHTKSPRERLDLVAAFADLSGPEVAHLAEFGNLAPDLADRLIENVVGTMNVPVGIATNMKIDGEDVLIPMATEEPSVVAAASNMASIARLHGGFHTSADLPIMVSQVQVVGAPDPRGARMRLYEAETELLALANDQDPLLVKLGGGARSIEVRIVEASEAVYVVLHLHVDVRDAMGANAVNTMAEAIAPRVAAIAGGRVRLRILTNKADRRLARVRAVFDRDSLRLPR